MSEQVPPTPRHQALRKRTILSRTAALLTAAALVAGPLAFSPLLATPAAAQGKDFATSFEDGDPTFPAQTAIDPSINVNSGTPVHTVIIPTPTVTTSNDFKDSEAGKNLADFDSNTKWLANWRGSGPEWAQYALPKAAAIDSYSLTTANDSPERDPKNWVLAGSNDGQTWTTLDTVTNGLATDPGRKTKVDFKLSRTAEFSYFRLTVTANRGGASLMQIADWDLSDSTRTNPSASGMNTVRGTGPSKGYNVRTGKGYTGSYAVNYSGAAAADGALSATNLIATDVNVPIDAQTELSYLILPTMYDYDPNYSSTWTALDLEVQKADGSVVRTSTLNLTDQYGFTATAKGQGSGKSLYVDQWNKIRVNLSSLAGGTVKRVFVQHNDPNGKAGVRFGGWLDDVAIKSVAPKQVSSLADYVDTRRGSNSDGGFSRGNNIPAVAVPNGFNFLTPMTDANSNTWMYTYAKDNNQENLPTLEGFGISHEPSPWMGDRNQLAFMPTLDGSAPVGTADSRATAFKHENETAQPDEYSIAFENGIKAKMTASDHGGVLAFQYPAGKPATVIADQVGGGDGNSSIKISSNGEISGWVDDGSGLSEGRSRMYIYGAFSQAPTAVGTGTGRSQSQFARFDGASTVELRFATSFISLPQAKHNMDLEVASRSYDDVHNATKSAWNDRLKVIDLSGSNASDVQKTSMYSSLYRLNLYPNSQSENVGSNEAPEWKYASPVAPRSGVPSATETNVAVKSGQIYVNNGFWDTYRSAWPLYSFLYPDLANKLISGFMQQYRDGGWVARWSSPGYANLMSGTSSDAAFSEAYALGTMPTNLAEEVYASAVKNSTVASRSDTSLVGSSYDWRDAVGRNGVENSQYLGWNSSVSWGLENAINDYAIAQMAKKLSADSSLSDEKRKRYADDAKYFTSRSQEFTNQFDPAVNFLLARKQNGQFMQDASSFNPQVWGTDNDYRESNGWTYMFMASQDPDGLTALLGGTAGIKKKLDEYYATPETMQYSQIHEAAEARDTRMGQLALSNQPGQGVPYMSAATGDPTRTQQIIREAMDRLFVGSEIGQGYPGDEDNGQTSAWYIYSALGFYPLQVGGKDFVLGSPLFDKVVVNRASNLGGPLTINAPGNTHGTPYVSGVSVGGEALQTALLPKDKLAKASELNFAMSSQPSAWGSFTKDAQAPKAWADATGAAKVTSEDGTDVSVLVDNTSTTDVTFPSKEANIVVENSSQKINAIQYTLTSATDGTFPTDWTLEGSNDGAAWTTLDQRSGQTFSNASQLRNFTIASPGVYSHYRFHITGSSGSTVRLAEIELLVDPATAAQGKLSLAPAEKVTGIAGVESAPSLATLTGASAQQASATIDFMDGAGPVPATLEPLSVGGFAVSAKHTFAVAGTYPVMIRATSGDDIATASASIQVLRKGSTGDLVGAAATVDCFATRGIGGSCDGQGWAYNSASLAQVGFAAGKTGSYTVGQQTMMFEVPNIAPSAPDTIVPQGQTFPLTLPAGATKISFVGLANEKQDLSSTVTLNFSDGSTQQTNVAFGDWVGNATSPRAGNTVVTAPTNRLYGTGDDDKKAALFGTDPVVLDLGSDGKAKTLVSITMDRSPNTLRQGMIHIAAVATDVQPAPSTLSITAKPAPKAVATKPVAATLASYSGAAPGSEVKTTINWGDGTAVDVSKGAAANLLKALRTAGSSAKAQSTTADSGDISGTHIYQKAGDYVVTVTVDDGVSSQAVTQQLTVTEPAVANATFNDQEYAPGASVTVNGTGFAPGETVTLKGTTPFGSLTVTAGADGSFTASIPVPTNAITGTYPVTVSAPSMSSTQTLAIRVATPLPGTSLALTAQANQVAAGTDIVLNVSATGTATGSVTIMENNAPVTTVALVGGQASVRISTTVAAQRTFTAVLPSAMNYLGSTSNAVTVQVTSGSAPNPGGGGSPSNPSPGNPGNSGNPGQGNSGQGNPGDGSGTNGGNANGQQPPTNGALPSTGAVVSLGALVVGGALVVVGLVLANRRVNRRKARSDG